MQNKMKREAIYIRTSKKDKDMNMSYDEQLKKLKSMSKTQAEGKIIFIYHDDEKDLKPEETLTSLKDSCLKLKFNVSKREGLLKLLKDADDRKFDTIRIIDLSRITNNFILQEAFFKFMKKWNIKIILYYGQLSDKFARNLRGIINQDKYEERDSSWGDNH